jgi:hypothetical protein
MNSDNVLGDTPLHLASYKGHLNIVRLLHSAGANLKTKNQVGNSSFVLAGKSGYVSVMLWLLEYGALNYYEEGDEEWEELEELTKRSLERDAKEKERKKRGKKSKKRASTVTASDSVSTDQSELDPHRPLWLANNPDEDEQFVSKGGDMRERWNVGSGHVSQGCVDKALGPLLQDDKRQRNLLRSLCRARLSVHEVFMGLVLPAALSIKARELSKVLGSKFVNGMSTLHVLGREKDVVVNIMPLIAEFLDVPRGRQLRNLREAMAML